MLNYIDLVAVLIVLLYVVLGYRLGWWSVFIRVIALIVGFFVSFELYQRIGIYLQNHFIQSPLIAYVLSFLVLFVIVQEIVVWILHKIAMRYPNIFFENTFTRLLAVIPAILESAVLILLIIVASTLLPIPTLVSQEIAGSLIGTYASNHTNQIVSLSDSLTGGKVSQAIDLLTTQSESEGTRSLILRPTSTSIDNAGELQMLQLVNADRAAAGVAPLTLDRSLTVIAEAHSQDMWDRQYFSHETPEGLTPFDRMSDAGISYTTAGENLAFSPSVQLANLGLMNSPGHKANILDPDFHKIGIGIIDGGIYGKMVTEDFTD